MWFTLYSYRRLEREKAELEQEFASFRREVRLSSGGTAVKDIRALKAVVRNLEEQLMREKTRYQRNTSKRSQEYRDLLEEVKWKLSRAFWKRWIVRDMLAEIYCLTSTRGICCVYDIRDEVTF